MAWPSASARTKTWGTEILTAGDLDGQFDILHTYNNDQLNATTGHKHSGGTSDGPQIPLTSGVTGILPVANGGTGSSVAANGAGGVVVPTGATNAASGAVILNSSGYLPVYYPYIKCSNTQTQNTNGGSTTSGGWNTLILNTKDNDTGSIATLSVNTISLPAGTYLVNATVPIYAPNSLAQIRLFNSTASAVLVNGQSTEGLLAQTPIPLRGSFTLGVTSTVVLQYQVTTSQSPNGQGVLANFGTEVYAVAEFTKIG